MPGKVTHGNDRLIDEMMELDLQVSVARRKGSDRMIRKAQRGARDFSDKHFIALRFFPIYEGEKEEEEGEGEGGEEAHGDKMDIDTDTKRDPRPEKLAEEILYKRGLAADHVRTLWKEPTKV